MTRPRTVEAPGVAVSRPVPNTIELALVAMLREAARTRSARRATLRIVEPTDR